MLILHLWGNLDNSGETPSSKLSAARYKTLRVHDLDREATGPCDSTAYHIYSKACLSDNSWSAAAMSRLRSVRCLCRYWRPNSGLLLPVASHNTPITREDSAEGQRCFQTVLRPLNPHCRKISSCTGFRGFASAGSSDDALPLDKRTKDAMAVLKVQ